MNRRVIVHSCHAETEIRNKEHLNLDRHYYSDDPKFESFKSIPKKCSCKKTITEEQAKIYIAQGKAFNVYKPKNNRPLDNKRIDRKQIVMPVDRSQTPRVDVITKADMERAYDRLDDPKSNKGSKYYKMIEEVHLMILEERAKLIIPFQDDPDAMYDDKGQMFAGRPLFPFGPDQRT